MEILAVQTEERDGLIHLALKGELDLSTVGKVQEGCGASRLGTTVLVLDLSAS